MRFFGPFRRPSAHACVIPMKSALLPRLLCSFFFCAATLAFAQPLDPDYNPNANAEVFAAAAQADGKILVGGNFTSLGGVARAYLARLNIDGSVDTAFSPNPSITVSALVVQPDGRILVGGGFTTIAGVGRVRIARLLATGAIDSTFSGGADSSVLCIALQPDGKVLLGGIFNIVNNATRAVLARLNADGSLDTAFNPVLTIAPSGIQNRVDTIVVQPDGKILVGGTFGAVDGVSSPGLVRLNADGSRDATFPVGSGALSVEAILLQSDGRIIVGGAFNTFAGLPRQNLARLSSTGVPDNQFGIVGPGAVVLTLALQSDGKLVAGGSFGSAGSEVRSSLARFNADGTFDPTFSFDTAGALGRSSPGVYALASPANGQLVIGGVFSSINGVTRNGLARLGLSAPTILTAPRAQSSPTGQPLLLSVGATGSGLSYQWSRNGTVLAGATNSTLSIASATVAHSGSYTVTVTNSIGSVNSAAAVVSVDPKSVFIVSSPTSRTVAAGSEVSLTVSAGGQPPVTYQWLKDGQPIADATGSTLAIGLALPAHAGAYSAVASDPTGSVTSATATLIVTGDVPFLVSTLAGRAASPGSADGPGTSAQFVDPNDLAVDTAGYLYVSDREAHAIRKISPAGVVTTLAGRSGTSGFADGTGSAALFNLPSGIVVDRSGNVFVADNNNNRIRKITPAGVVTTFVGAAQGSVDGNATVARLTLPQGLALDAAGNLYFCESATHTIRRVTPAGEVTTIAGGVRANGHVDGPGTTARFNAPAGLAIDAAGLLYVADTSNHVIRRITLDGQVSTLTGEVGNSTARDGSLATARFFAPRRLAFDPAGNLFVNSTSSIRRIGIDGNVTTPLGSATGGFVDALGTSARFASVLGLAIDSLGQLYISDDNNFVIRKATLLGVRSARLANLSVRSRAGTGSDTLIVGFNVAGGSKSLLLRAVGPTLSALGVSGVLADPSLRLESEGTLIAQNEDWSAGASGATIGQAAASAGAFALSASSRDAAVLSSLNAGSFTAQVGGGSGVALVEVYEVGSASTGRLANLSARTRAGTNADTLIVGFVIGGDAPKTVLIRGIGPTLAAFGVDGVLANPRLSLYRDTMLVAENAAWGGSTALAAAFGQVGAFPLASDSRDAALLVTLLPGAYTAQLTGAANTTGVALVEIYEAP